MLLLIFILLLPPEAASQNYPFKEFSVSDGLPQSQARGLFQDSRGYLWIMTRNGISRFDGMEFKNYFRNNGLPSNIIRQIFEDAGGTLWALSGDGLSKYDGYKFEFLPYREKLLSETFIGAITVSDTCFLLVKNPLTQKNRPVYFKDGAFYNYALKNPVLDTLDIENARYDRLSNCLLILDSYRNLWKWHEGVLTREPGLKIENLKEDRGRIILVGNGKYYELKEGGIVPYRFGQTAERTEVMEDRTEKGDFLHVFRDNMVTRIKSPYYSNVLIDDESNIWLGSEVNLFMLSSLAFSFFDERDGLPKNTWTIAEDRNGHIWFGTLTGDLLEFDGEKFSLRNEYKKLFNKNASFYKGSIRSADGNVYFSLNQGVLIWNGNSFSRLPEIPDNTQVCIIYEDPADRSLLLGTDRGLYHIKDGMTEKFPEFTDRGFGIIEGIVRDGQSGYWLSGERGIVHFDGRNSVPVIDTLLPDGYTFTLIKDNRGGLWVTSDEGLFFKHKSSQNFSYGLPQEINNSANSIIPMDSSHLLVGRMADVCIIDLAKFYNKDPGYFRIYDNSYGFTGSDCLDNGIIRDKKGIFWILSSGKATVLNPAKLVPNRIPPRVHITDVEFESDSLTWESLHIPGLFYGSRDQIKIDYKHNNLRISFTGISFTNPAGVMYQYRLTGHEDVWSHKDYQREAVFQKLSPGDYEFQLKAFNSDGLETPEICSLKLSIIPAFWQTLTFKIIAILLSLFLVVLITWVIAKLAIRKKNETEQTRNELTWLQMNLMIRQFDPHFTFNVISSVGSLIMKGQKETAYDYIVKLSGLLRNLLAEGSVMIRPLSEELDFIRRYCDLQQLRFKERICCNFLIDDKVDLQRLIPKMTIQTFVENSIRHGIENRPGGGEVTIRLHQKEGFLEIIVTDNGVGRKGSMPAASNESGYGLKTINSIFDFTNRINSSKAKIEMIDLLDSANNPAGLEVRITIPDNFNFNVKSIRQQPKTTRR